MNSFASGRPLYLISRSCSMQREQIDLDYIMECNGLFQKSGTIQHSTYFVNVKNFAFTATIIVLRDMSAAPIAGLRSIPWL